MSRTVLDLHLKVVREDAPGEPGYDRVTLLFGDKAVAESGCRSSDEDDVAAERALGAWLRVGHLW